jgi:hypothetical protein
MICGVEKLLPLTAYKFTEGLCASCLSPFPSCSPYFPASRRPQIPANARKKAEPARLVHFDVIRLLPEGIQIIENHERDLARLHCGLRVS